MAMDFNANQANVSTTMSIVLEPKENETTVYEDRSASQYMEKYYSLCLLAFGTVGNLLSFAVLSRKAFRVTAVSVYLRFLSLSDIGAIYTGVMYFTAKSLFDLNVRHQSLMSCKFHRWLSFTFCDTSSWALVLVSSARLISIVWPMKRIITRKRAYIAIAITVTICLGANIPIFIMYGDVEIPERNITKLCVPISKSWDDFYTYVFGWIVLLKFAFLPGVLLIVLNTALVLSVSRSGKAVDKIQGKQEGEKGSKGFLGRFRKGKTEKGSQSTMKENNITMVTSASETSLEEIESDKMNTNGARHNNMVKVRSLIKLKGLSETGDEKAGDEGVLGEKIRQNASSKSENQRRGNNKGNEKSSSNEPLSPSKIKLSNKCEDEVSLNDNTRNKDNGEDQSIRTTNDLSKANEHKNDLSQRNNFDEVKDDEKIKINKENNSHNNKNNNNSNNNNNNIYQRDDSETSAEDNTEKKNGQDNPAFVSDDNEGKKLLKNEPNIKNNQDDNQRDNKAKTISTSSNEEGGHAEFSMTFDEKDDFDLNSTEDSGSNPTTAPPVNHIKPPSLDKTEKPSLASKSVAGHANHHNGVVRAASTSALSNAKGGSGAAKSANSQASSQNKSKTLTRTLLVINTVFLVCNAPITIYLSGKAYLWPDTDGFPPSKELFVTTANFMMYTNNSINFIFYCVTGSRFRKELVLLFKDIFQLVRGICKK